MANEEAEAFRKKGNDLFKEQKWDEAVKQYNKAIQLDPSNASYYSNRSAASCKLGNYKGALTDANKCLEADPKFIKGFVRKGAALEFMGNADEAESAYQEGLEIDADDAMCKRGLENVKASRRSARSSGGGGGGIGGLLSHPMLKQVMERFKKGGRLQMYLVLFMGYYAFTSWNKAGKGGGDSGVGTPSSNYDQSDTMSQEDEGSGAAAGAKGSVHRAFADVDGKWISFLRIEEKKADTTLVLLHRTSLSAEAEYGAGLIGRLGDLELPGGLRLIAPDRPCHGFSPCPSSGEPQDASKWLNGLVTGARPAQRLTVVASGREAARQAFALARRRPEAVQVLLISPSAVAPTGATMTGASDVRAWLTQHQSTATAQAAVDAARWAASGGSEPTAGKAVNVAKLPKDCKVTILYGQDDEEDQELVVALEAQGVEARTRSATEGDSLEDALVDEVRQSLSDDSGGYES